MRKIWTSRKDRDKRKSISASNSPSLFSSGAHFESSSAQHNNSSYTGNQSDVESAYHDTPQSISEEFHDDYSTLNGTTDSVKASSAGSVFTSTTHDYTSSRHMSGHIRSRSSVSISTSTPKSVYGLVKHDYDTRLVKNGWLNGIVNSSTVSEISDQTLRLVRVELKGSHLYLYKPNPALNIKNFRVNTLNGGFGMNGSESNDDLLPVINSSNGNTALNPIEQIKAANLSTASLSSGSEVFKNANSSNLTIHDIGAPAPIPSSGVQPLQGGAALTTSASPSKYRVPPEVPEDDEDEEGFQRSINENRNGNPDNYHQNISGNTTNSMVTGNSNKNSMTNTNTNSHNTTNTWASSTANSSNAHQQQYQSLATPAATPQINVDEKYDDAFFTITYFSTKLPHPDLSFDFKSHTFITSIASICQSSETSPSSTPNSIESLLHFILFDVEEADNAHIVDLINILPIFPSFGKILRLVADFLASLYTKKFQGYFNQSVVIDRVLKILYNVEENFDGFLLKSDIAPFILRILEILGDAETTEIESARISKFKKVMLHKQQSLINLVNNDRLTLSSSAWMDINPFQDLNSMVFMKDINLIEFVQTISAIDLRFFQNWNSNIDKSLLLFSSINGYFDSASYDHGSADYFYKKNPLIFNNDHHIHYLSRLLVNHIFVEHSSTPSLSSSTLERKARLLEKWIDLGCLLDKSGNMSSWLGISSIILSQPVLRLTKIWSLVSPNYIKLLKNDWSPVLFELDRRHLANGSPEKLHGSSPSSPGKEELRDSINFKDSYHIMAPRGLGKIYPKEKVIPYFGDLVINNNSTTDIFELESIWKRINYSFNRWNEYLSNLTNYYDVINYNDDVLRRYDSMGFIFSNESLNQVLYLGANEDGKPIPPPHDDARMSRKSNSSNLSSGLGTTHLTEKLLKLIELNCDSVNLEKIMHLSLNLEPDLPEAYLKTDRTPVPNSLELNFARNLNISNISIPSTGSSASLTTEIEAGMPANDNLGPSTAPSTPGLKSSSAMTAINEHNPAARIPSFNDKYFKINLAKYDDLAKSHEDSVHQRLEASTNKYNYIIDDELTFRVDDFVSEVDSANNTTYITIDDVDNVDVDDDVPGLGIDVDDILNSDKFANFTMSPKATANSPAVNRNTIQGETNGANTTSQTLDHPLRFIPKYATIDKLIDLLLIDVRYFDHDINLDLTEYRFVFLLNYNSFITTKELLDKLALRFINSGNAVISVMKKEYFENNPEYRPQHLEFPNWNLDATVDLNELGDVDYELLLKIQINILKVLIVLINNFYSNFSLDLGNKKILIKLLKLFSNEILQWYNSNKIDATLEKSFESLVNYYKKLKKLFVKKTYRPIEISKFDEYIIKEFKFNNSLHEVPMNRNLPSHKNVSKIEKFLHKFNKLLTVFYKGIKAEDWIRVYKIIETVYEANGLFEFNLQKSSVPEEQMVISNVFTFFETLVEPTERQLILKKFPLVFRKLFKLYFKFRSYILIQLTDLNITVEERLDRMKTLLIMCKISKLKMSDNQFVFEGGRGNIPSCIETAITNVIYSPESRLFTNLWIKASCTLNGDDTSTPPTSSYDDLNSLLPVKVTASDLQSGEPLLPCFGWIIQNIIETNKCPSFYKDSINFNKRYLIFKLIKELGVEDLDNSEAPDFTYYDSREFDFLLKLDESLVDNQSLREFTFLDKDRAKLFKAVLHEQRKLLVLDNKKKSLRESKLVPTGGSSATTGGNSAIQSKKPINSNVKRQSISYKANSSSRFKISGLFTKTRPFSLNVSNYNSAERQVGIDELPNPDLQFETKQKPFAVVSLKGKKIFPVYLLPLCFKVDSENGGEDFFFQAPSEDDLNQWMVKLNYANRHWFYSRTLNVKGVYTNTTFGIPISVICAREQSTYPRFLEMIFDEIETEGLKDVGIYRISSSMSELISVKAIIDRTGSLNLNEKVYDTHTLTSVVKSFFRELPDALLSDNVISAFFALNKEESNRAEPEDEYKTLDKYKEILKTLPFFNYNTLKLLLSHLQKVSHFSEDNKMTSSNLATVIGPALTEASNLESLINNFGFMNSILEKLILNFDYVFNDVVIGSMIKNE